MKAIKIIDLEEQTELDCYLCHQSGEVLHKPGEPLTLAHLHLMENCGIESVTILKKEDDPKIFKQKIQLKKVALEDISAEEICPVSLFDETQKIILEKGAVIPAAILSGLGKKGVKTLYYNRDSAELGLLQFKKYTILLKTKVHENLESTQKLVHPKNKLQENQEDPQETAKTEGSISPVNFKNLFLDPIVMFGKPSVEITEANLQRGVKNSAEMRKRPTGASIDPKVIRITEMRAESQVSQGVARYDQWVTTLSEQFQHFKGNRAILFQTFENLAKDIASAFAEDCFFYLNFFNRKLSYTDDQYLPTHCVQVCLVACRIASVIGFEAKQILEIACGALLHDVGHVLTPKNLMSRSALQQADRVKYDQHTAFGLAQLKHLDQLPQSAAYIVYQHHERINGSGKPLGFRDVNIHDFAKLVGVAEEFVFLSSKKAPAVVMNGILAMIKSNHLDGNFIKALLISVSQFPLGSWVIVTGNKICKVIGTNGVQFKKPVLRALFQIKEKQLQELPNPETINLEKEKNIEILKYVDDVKLNLKYLEGF